MATVLKQNVETEKTTAARKLTGLAGFNLDDLAVQGRAQLDATKKHAQKILDEAHQEAERIKKKAFQDGRQAGLQQAESDVQERVRREAAESAKNQVALMQEATHKLHQQHEHWMQEYTQLFSGTVLAAVEKIVMSKLGEDRSTILRWAQEALQQTRAATELTVALHPEALAELGQALDELVASSEMPEGTTVRPDESLNVTDLVIRQTGGEIRAGLASQLARLEELLK